MHSDDQQLRLERTLSDRLAECSSLTQHIPRTNSIEEGPCYSELSAERQRMQERLFRYSLCEREVKGDGNCQVRHVPVHKELLFSCSQSCPLTPSSTARGSSGVMPHKCGILLLTVCCMPE